MRLRILILSITLAASVLLCGRSEAQVADYGIANGVLSFEEGTAPAVCSKGSELSLSSEHAKLGANSLKWEWKTDKAFISIKGGIPYLPENPNPKETSIASFVFWMYSPTTLKGTVRFSFLKKGKECCHFDYNLGFEGWRGSWVGFDRDMQGKPEIGMDEVRIYAPSGIKKGQLFFDGLITSSFQDVRYHTPDWQAPYVNEKTDIHWLILNNSWKLNLDIPLKTSLTTEEIDDIKTVKERFVQLISEKAKPYTLQEAREMYDTYGISFNADGTIKGKPIYFIRYGETYLNQGIPDAKQTFGKNGQLLKDLNDRMLRLAVSVMRSENQTEKEEMCRMYINLTRHLLDQGFAAGSGQGTLHHLGYSMRNFYTGPVIMQDVLKEAGLDQEVQKAMEWFSGVGEIKIAPKEPGMDIDAFNTSLMGRTASLLMLEDTPYKYSYLQALSRWIDNGMKHTDGLKPCFKRDGSVVHHRKSYPAYATGGFTGAVNAVWMLAKTSFAVSQESHQNLKDALLAMRFYCYGGKFPLAMSGRHPDGKGGLIKSHYSLLAKAGSPDGKKDIDKDLMTALKTTPEGTRFYGFNCSMSHRYGNRLVTIAGHSRYIWAAEIYNQANHYGRYLTHGSMQVDGPHSGGGAVPFACGFHQEGWDWCHIPATTAAVLPMSQMKANVLNVDEHSGYEEMLLSDEWFAGGVTHKGISGAFAMKLHEHDKYNGSLRARKSFFAFRNIVICLGSDIENALEGSDVHTTLFQNYIGPEGEKTQSAYMNKRGDILRDGRMDIYFLRGSEAECIRGLQHSLHEETDAPTEGYFEKAYINHGDIVKDGKYEYMLFMPVTKDEIEFAFDENALDEYSKELPYTVLRHDRSVHGVADHESGTRAFAVFEPGQVDSVVLNSSSAMLMYSASEETMTLSVANPDLAMYEGPSDEVFDKEGRRIERSVYGRKWIDNPCGETCIELTIKGLWEIYDSCGSKVYATAKDGNTTLTFSSTEGRTEEIILKRIML